MESHHQPSPNKDNSALWLGAIAAVLVVGVLVSVLVLKNGQKNNGQQASASMMNGAPQMMANNDAGGSCPGGGHKAVMMVGGDQVVTCGTPTNGLVTNVTSDTVTISDESDNSSKTYKITGDTVIAKKGGVRVSLSDITVGENIGVIPNDDNTAALRILAELPQGSAPTTQTH